ncbi:MAG TPA: c-type cytochrome [Gammaproteobacteria bacterium]|nr:c-type cytochrome [Gammaproteobacteria bacterium]
MKQLPHLIWLMALILGNLPLTVAANDSDLAKGKKIYDRFCIYCHGEKGEGDGPAGSLSGVATGDLSNKAYMSQLSDQELHDRIAWGEEKYPYLQMPGWRSSLNENEIRAVMLYVRTLAVDKGPLTTPSPKEREKKFQTDPLERGRIYYLHYCSGCHGKSGHGDGEAAKNMSTKPAALSNPGIAATITTKSVNDYLTARKQSQNTRNMPIFEDDFKDKVDEIVLYIKTLAKVK